MHLLNARTRGLEHFVGSNIPRYAILSHTWGDDEVSMQDLTNGPDLGSKAGYAKIEYTCDQALRDELSYAWVDCCCIDRTSSTELSEAINSMFRWYARAAKCYAYLPDVPGDGEPHRASTQAVHTAEQCEYLEFSRSRWFTRGWTLQELIAPEDVVFFAQGWRLIGNRNGLRKTISEITRIDVSVLTDRERLQEISIARRMSWAAKRETTRKEDEAYCLLGIFGVNIALVYGEEERAFIRLQEEIIRTSTDQSIFAWKQQTAVHSGALLAPSPNVFAGCHKVFQCAFAPFDEPYEVTNAGLRISLPLIKVAERRKQLGILNCEQDGKRLALWLTPASVDIFNKIRNTYGVSTSSLDQRLTCVSVDSAVATKKSNVVIVRDRKPRMKDGVEPVQLLLRLRNVTYGPSLRVECVYPSDFWNISGWMKMCKVRKKRMATSPRNSFQAELTNGGAVELRFAPESVESAS